MNIVICGSMSFSPEMVEIREKLKEAGHDVTLPDFTEEYAKLNERESMHSESVQNKINHDLIRGHFEKIKNSDSVLIYNQTKKGIENYIGGNTLLEMGFAHVLNKKIFLFNPIPEISYKDEIKATKPTILNKDLTAINL